MDYMDAWNGKKMVVSSLEQVCVAIKKFLIATPILSLNMLAQFCSPFFFSLSLCLVVGARVQEACCYATPCISTQYG